MNLLEIKKCIWITSKGRRCKISIFSCLCEQKTAHTSSPDGEVDFILFQWKTLTKCDSTLFSFLFHFISNFSAKKILLIFKKKTCVLTFHIKYINLCIMILHEYAIDIAISQRWKLYWLTHTFVLCILLVNFIDKFWMIFFIFYFTHRHTMYVILCVGLCGKKSFGENEIKKRLNLKSSVVTVKFVYYARQLILNWFSRASNHFRWIALLYWLSYDIDTRS